MKLQDEALLYLRDNITREEAYYILTTENEMTEVLIAKKEDGGSRQDVNAILNNINREKVMKYPYIAIQLDNIQTVEKRRVVFEITGHRMDDNKERIDFMFVYFMARML